MSLDPQRNCYQDSILFRSKEKPHFTSIWHEDWTIACRKHRFLGSSTEWLWGIAGSAQLHGDCPRNNLGVAAKQIGIAHGMRSRHAEDTTIDGARDGARDDAEMPNATIPNSAKTALAETLSLEPQEPFMTPHRRRTLAALHLEQFFQV